MCGTTCSEKATVALQIEVKFGGMSNVAIDDSACWAVTTPIGVPMILWEKSNVMPLANDNDRDSGFDLEFVASSSQS